MFTDINTPRARHWTVPAMLAGIFITFAFADRDPNVWTAILFVIAACFGAWALVNLAHHVFHVVWDMRREDRELTYKMSANYHAELLSRMNAEQIKAMRAGMPVYELIPTEGGGIQKMYGFECYDAMTYHIITMSDDRRVYPIRNFGKETYYFDVIGDHQLDDYKQAHNVHAWLCWMGFAEWGTGNEPCHWKNGFTPDKVLARLGWVREQDDDVIQRTVAG